MHAILCMPQNITKGSNIELRKLIHEPRWNMEYLMPQLTSKSCIIYNDCLKKSTDTVQSTTHNTIKQMTWLIYLDSFEDTRSSCHNILNNKTAISSLHVTFNQLLCSISLGFLSSYQHRFTMAGRNELQHKSSFTSQQTSICANAQRFAQICSIWLIELSWVSRV